METVTVVVSEILGFLAIAWVLGFFVAWSIFRPIKLEYKKEIEDSEESIGYLKHVIRNQEREITKLTIELQELSKPQHAAKEFLETQKKKQKKWNSDNRPPRVKNELVKSEDSMLLKEIEATLENIK